VPATALDLVSKYIGAGEDTEHTRLNKLGGTEWAKTTHRAKAAAKDLAEGLIKLYAERKRLPGFAFAADSPWQQEFEESFEYAETDDQLRCIDEIKRDMESPSPMDRLLCGDVGFGKTEVALRAAMKCILDGKQVAILVPTTVLAQQHYLTAMRRFATFPVTIDVLSRFRTPAQIKKTLFDLQSGKIDLIVTKSVSRFARNVLDSLNYIFMLRKLDPPVGVYFETEKLNTLDRSSDMVITVLSLVAQSESEQKSNSLKWSFKRRRAQGLGIYPNWSLLGYKGHDWEIDEDEADVVRTIYSLYLEGYSSTQIADLLTKSGILTVKGLSTWSSGSVLGILRNEKYCGDALCQKTVTVDFFTHKSVKNNGLETQYFIEGHHAPIIEKRDWLLVQQIRKERRYTRRQTRKCKPRIVVKGPLAGFIIADPKWGPEDVDSIMEKLSRPTEIVTSPMLEDENFMIEKE